MKPVEARWPRFALAAFAVLQDVRRLRAQRACSRALVLQTTRACHNVCFGKKNHPPKHPAMYYLVV